MDQAELLAAYRSESNEAKVRLLLELSHKITIVARDACEEGEILKPGKLIKINEFQHRLLRIILDLVGGQGVRTDDEVAEYLYVGCTECGATQMLTEVFRH